MTEGVYVFPDFDEADPSRTFLKNGKNFLSSVDEKTLGPLMKFPSLKIYGPGKVT